MDEIRTPVQIQIQVQEQPLFAELRDDDRTAVVSIFGREILLAFRGAGAEAKATRCVNWWNEHLDREWMGVRETTAAIMQRFIAALQDLGVRDDVINAAMGRVKESAGQD